MKLVFAHGWAYTPQIWEPLLSHLEAHDSLKNKKISTCIIDLAFGATHPVASRDIPQTLPKAGGPETDGKTVCIGHSLGVLWLLKNMPSPPHALISINGFWGFSGCASPAQLAHMEAGLRKNAALQVKHFYRQAGDRTSCPPPFLHKNNLMTGLKILQTQEALHELDRLDCPVLALASENDRIVPTSISRQHWGKHRLIWHKTAAHALPVNAPAWCAHHILSWLETI